MCAAAGVSNGQRLRLVALCVLNCLKDARSRFVGRLRLVRLGAVWFLACPCLNTAEQNDLIGGETIITIIYL